MLLKDRNPTLASSLASVWQALEAADLAQRRCRTAGEAAMLSHNQGMGRVQGRSGLFATTSSKYGARQPLEQVCWPCHLCTMIIWEGVSSVQRGYS